MHPASSPILRCLRLLLLCAKRGRPGCKGPGAAAAARSAARTPAAHVADLRMWRGCWTEKPKERKQICCCAAPAAVIRLVAAAVGWAGALAGLMHGCHPAAGRRSQAQHMIRLPGSCRTKYAVTSRLILQLWYLLGMHAALLPAGSWNLYVLYCQLLLSAVESGSATDHGCQPWHAVYKLSLVKCQNTGASTSVLCLITTHRQSTALRA
jgi:hypothetical protein